MPEDRNQTTQAITQQKKKMRVAAIAARNAMDERACQVASAAITAHLKALPAFSAARGVHCFISLPGEVNTRHIFDACQELGIPTAVPVQAKSPDEQPTQPETREVRGTHRKNWLECVGWQPDDPLAEGPFGVLEPAPEHDPKHDPKNREYFALDQIDLVVTPGLAFDPQGRRLGYGMGYYDDFIARLLTARKNRPELPDLVLAGVCFATQTVAQVPTHPWDLPMTHIITEAGVRVVERKGGRKD